jgi:hypothetical protein
MEPEGSFYQIPNSLSLAPIYPVHLILLLKDLL